MRVLTFSTVFPALFAIFLFASCTKQKLTVAPPLPPQKDTNNVVLLYFDGYVLEGTGWNLTQPVIHCPASGLSQADRNIILATVRKHFDTFRVIFTVDSNLFNNNTGYRQRVIISYKLEATNDRPPVPGFTPTPYSKLGGNGFMTSMMSKDPEYLNRYPALVYAENLGFAPIKIAGAISHELGHSLGLGHNLIEPAIMGTQFWKVDAWWRNDDIEIIAKTLGYD